MDDTKLQMAGISRIDHRNKQGAMLFITISEPCAITEEIFNILYKKSPNWYFESERYDLNVIIMKIKNTIRL